MSNLDELNDKLKIAMGVKKSTPNITVNKLGEFIVATPTRQRRILEQLKYPKDNAFGFMYEDAREAIKQYLINGRDESILLKCIEYLEEREAGSEWQVTQVASSVEALDAVLHSTVFDDLKIEFEAYTGSNPRMIIEGVHVSVFPDLIVRCKRRGENYIGGLKIHLSKNGSFGEEGAKYISAIIHQFADMYIKTKGAEVRPAENLSYDVFTDSLVPCPAAVKRRWDDIQAACKNIVAIWDTI